MKKTYLIPQAFQKPLKLQALCGVSFELKPGKTLAIVGESGCGKTTLAKVLMHLEEKTGGSVRWENADLSTLESGQLSEIIQIVFQDPNSSLNPRKKIFDSIAEPLRVKNLSEEEITRAIHEVAKEVGLREDWLGRYPHMLSGGQKQRVGIARALITKPKVMICDEPVSALDVSVQAQVLNLLLDLQASHAMSYLFISHDLSVVRFIAHEIAVLYFGEIVEYADKSLLFQSPLHPYTQLLLKSAPKLGDVENIELIQGELPSPLNPPQGCAFQSRCSLVTEKCRKEKPNLQKKGSRLVSCHQVEV